MVVFVADLHPRLELARMFQHGVVRLGGDVIPFLCRGQYNLILDRRVDADAPLVGEPAVIEKQLSAYHKEKEL